jgi:pimeloyl-ACP methyl ester carboxylesterase
MRPSWVDNALFPFESRYLDLDGYRMHYVDEGQGMPIVFSHGTPEWSFGWRDLIVQLRGQYRCLAPDLLGMGLSDKPADADYSVRAHAERFEQFVEARGLEKIHLVANDFGVSIALYYAIKHPEKVEKISLFNGWMWPVNEDPHYATPARMMRGWLGRFMYLKFNFPVNVIMPRAYGDRRKLSKPVHQHYQRALSTPAERRAAYQFALELLDATSFWAWEWENIDAIRHKPFLVFWGMKDSFVPPSELEKWSTRLTNAEIIRLDKAGHFAQEEASEEMAAAMGRFLG